MSTGKHEGGKAALLAISLATLMLPLRVCAQEAVPLTPESDPAEFYGALFSSLGGNIDNIDLTLGGVSIKRRADEKGYARYVTFYRSDWRMTINKISVHSRDPVSAAALEGGSTQTLILPLVVRIGEVVYHEPVMGVLQYWWEPDADTPPMPTPTPSPTPSPLPEPATGPHVEYRVAEIRIDQFIIENGSFEYEKTFRNKAGEEYHEPLNIREINLEVKNLALTPYDGATDLAPLKVTARMETDLSPPTVLNASGYLFPEYDALSFKINGHAETVHLKTLQPLIPYVADIYLDDGTAVIDFVATCKRNELEFTQDTEFYNVRTSTSGQDYNPFKRVSRKAVEKVDERNVSFSFDYTIGSGVDFGNAYGEALMGAIGKEFGGKLAASFAVQAPLVLGETVFGIFTWPFRSTKKGPRGAYENGHSESPKNGRSIPRGN